MKTITEGQPRKVRPVAARVGLITFTGCTIVAAVLMGQGSGIGMDGFVEAFLGLAIAVMGGFVCFVSGIVSMRRKEHPAILGAAMTTIPPLIGLAIVALLCCL